jgi:hypothetical protein
MKILLIDIDSHKAPNIALKKIEMYHLERGDEVIWNFSLAAPTVDRIYVSCLFSWNKEKAAAWKRYPYALIGGSGYDLNVQLPPEIEKMTPRINYGFTTRGCPKRCKYCIVPQKEGKIMAVGDIYDLWDRESTRIILIDNNIMALPGHFKNICQQLLKEDLKIDFQQGLDMDYLTPDHIQLLQQLRRKEYKFAWDSDDLSPARIKKIAEMFEWFGKCQFYVLAGHLPFEITMKKLEILKGNGHNGYLMRLENVMKDRLYITLAQWVNQKWTFHKYSFKEFCVIKRGEGWYEKQMRQLNESLVNRECNPPRTGRREMNKCQK